MAGWKHPELRREKKLQGLPSLAFLDAEGTVLVTVPSDQRTLPMLRQWGQRAERYVTLRAAVAAGDAAAAAPFLLLQLEEGQLELASATDRRARLGDIADAELRAIIDARLVDLAISTDLRRVGQADRHTLGERFFAILQDGPRPTEHVSRGFHYAMLEWAERRRDAKAFAAALADMTRVLGATEAGKAWVLPLLDRYRATLAALRRAGG